MKARDFEKEFDAREDVTAHLDLAKARRPGQEQQRLNFDFPVPDRGSASNGARVMPGTSRSSTTTEDSS
jgi:hypothetical protein